MLDEEEIGTRHGELRVEKEIRGKRLEITLKFRTDRECLLHWGVSRAGKGPWQAPPEEIRPPKTRPYDDHAVQTPFGQGGVIHILMEDVQYAELPFVLYFPQRREWDNNEGRDYRILLPTALRSVISPYEGGAPSSKIEHKELQGIAEKIIQKETGRDSWTLMHRYNLCHELLDRVQGSREGLALVFVWFRFSALRQLDWQRNFNTQPRELSHAQQRLTSRLAELYGKEPSQRELIRLLLTTIGHGGEGQRIRDEILEIMHRYGIREVSENFIEQWHQKMHNNTTPDDIVICESYLAFLRSNGDPRAFWRTLEAGGVTRRRLESFERPIVAQPDFYPGKKEAMIRDFEHFLGTLKSVHSAMDLGICIHAARHEFDSAMHFLADYIWEHRDAAGRLVIHLFQEVAQLRSLIAKRFESTVSPDLLCLDVALEDFLRTSAERNIGSEMEEKLLLEWLSLTADGFLLAHAEQDLSLALLQWNRIRKSAALDMGLTLQAESALDRMERSVGDYVHDLRNLLQPKAESLGNAFHADSWTISLFSEEVVRGGLIFALSLLCRRLRSLLRQRAKLSPWQLVSRARGRGKVEVMESLDAVQGRRFDPPVLIVLQRLRGNEDLPEGVVAVLTPDSVDVVSHVAIRARNQGILLATCYDEKILEDLKSSAGKFMCVEPTSSGQVRFEPAEESGMGPGSGAPAGPVRTSFIAPPDAPYVITEEEFKEGLVGGKSLNLKRLRGKLPDWIHLPVLIALPFATFGKVLGSEINRKTRERYAHLSAQVEKEPKALPELRKAVMELAAPDDFHHSLRQAMEKAALTPQENTERVWECIKGVWASKWNDRAYWNRKSLGIPHENLLMAVLVQDVVPARYAYVIHTVHPFSENKEEMYAEVVLGLGETLAGNYPGRALGFSCRKAGGDLRLLSYPSKSIGLYGRGLILRSDSSGEDLAGFAGAGLYSSFEVEPPKEVHLNYADERLVQNEAFRNEILAGIARVGVLVEEAMGSPQDIEGVFAEGRHYVVQTRPQVGIAP